MFFNVSALSRSLNDRKFYCSITFLHMARSLGFSSFGSPDFFKENSKNVRHNRRPDKNAFSCKVKVMMDGGNRRRSVSQVVIGFSDEHRAALRDQDKSFYGDIISDDDSEGSVSSKPPWSLISTCCFFIFFIFLLFIYVSFLFYFPRAVKIVSSRSMTLIDPAFTFVKFVWYYLLNGRWC